ncbi:MAG: hypothetical protein IJZ16_14300 [Clostridia bacterium]|nr:hypothetical protein [Clostridia bacterium]
MLKGLYFALLAIFILLVIIFLVVRVREGGVKALFLKVAASMTFIMSSIISLSLSASNYYYGIFIVVGLIFGLLGDVWLDLKYVHRDYDEPYTFAGMISFLIGHIFYIVGILRAYPKFVPWQIALAIFSAIGVTAIARFLDRNKEFNYGKFNLLTLVYSVITMLTVTFSLNAMNCFAILPMADGVDTSAHLWRFVIMFIGTVLFALSDLVLSRVYFLKGGNTSKNVVVNHVLYFSAQFILTLSIHM